MARGLEVGVYVRLGVVVCRDFVALAAFFVQPKPPALPLGVVILDAHRDGGADAREAENHEADERAIAEANDGRHVDGVEQRPGVFGREHG